MNVSSFTKYFIPIYCLSIKIKITPSKVNDGPYGRRSCRDNNELITLTWTSEKLAICALRKWHGIISVILSKSQFKKKAITFYTRQLSPFVIFKKKIFPAFFFISKYFIYLFITFISGIYKFYAFYLFSYLFS